MLVNMKFRKIGENPSLAAGLYPGLLLLSALFLPAGVSAAVLSAGDRDTVRAAPRPDTVQIAASTARQAFNRAQKVNTVAGWDRFLRQFPNHRLSNIARDARNALLATSPAPSGPTPRQAFRDAQRTNTVAGWDNFLRQFPTGRLANLARDERNALLATSPAPTAPSPRQAFRDAQRTNTVAGWDRFLRQFPTGRLANLARDERNALLATAPAPSGPTRRQAFQDAQRTNTIAGWDRFLRQFPNGRMANLARDARAALVAQAPAPTPNRRDAFRTAQRTNTISGWDRFLVQFPNGRLADLARDARDALVAQATLNRRDAFRAAQRTNTIAGWESFLSQFPNGRLADLARHARDDLVAAARPTRRDAFRTAQRTNTIAGWDRFLSQFPNGRLADLARDARDDLVAAARPTRRDAFRTAQRTNTIAGWDEFLSLFPNGRLADLARDARDDLVAATAPPPNRRQAFRDAQRVNTIAEWDRFLSQFPTGRLADLARDARDDLIAAAPAPGISGKPRSYWMQDGSLVGLVARGKRRAFVYSDPTRDLRRSGVRPGMDAFQGVNDQSFYTGTAFLYPQNCGKQSYDVAGPVRNSGRRVVLRGREPVFRSDCSISGYRAQTLVFEFQAKAN